MIEYLQVETEVKYAHFCFNIVFQLTIEMSLQVKVHTLISYLWLRNLLDFDLFLDFPRIITIFTSGIKLKELFHDSDKANLQRQDHTNYYS